MANGIDYCVGGTKAGLKIGAAITYFFTHLSHIAKVHHGLIRVESFLLVIEIDINNTIGR
jgi:hypothetical protein